MRIAVLFPLLAALAPAFGQIRGGGNMDESAASIGSASETSLPTSGGKGLRRTINVAGRVTMRDGSPVPANIAIVRTCGSIRTPVAYADSNGNFTFQWQPPSGAIPRRTAAADLQTTGCDVLAQVAGYQSSVANLLALDEVGSMDIGVLVLQPQGKEQGSTVSATSYAAPANAKKAYDKGQQLSAAGKPEQAAKEFEKAVAAYPKYADAWLSLGQARLRQRDSAGAREALLKAIEADSKLVGPYVDLGLIAVSQSQWEPAAEYLDKALQLDAADFPQAWFPDAAANFNLKKYDVAERSAREARKLDPKHANPQIDFLLGLLLTQKRDFDAAAEEYRTYLRLAPGAPDAAMARQQLTQIENYKAASGQ